jgi:hypothetical protein
VAYVCHKSCLYCTGTFCLRAGGGQFKGTGMNACFQLPTVLGQLSDVHKEQAKQDHTHDCQKNGKSVIAEAFLCDMDNFILAPSILNCRSGAVLIKCR